MTQNSEIPMRQSEADGHEPAAGRDGSVPTATTSASPTLPRRQLSPGTIRVTSKLGSLVVVALAWQLIGTQVNPLFVSYPTAIWNAFVRMVARDQLWPAFIDTMKPMALGYLIAILIGIPIGILLGRYRIVESVGGMYVTAGYATPLVALIPLFVLWFGLGFAVKAFVVLVMSVFPIIINTWSGAKLVPKSLIEVGESFVASPPTVLRKIVLPATIPYIMTGLRLGLGRAVIGVVIAEFFTAIGGLGGIIINSQQRFDTASMMVPILILLALGVGLTAALGYLESKVAPWQTAISGREGDA